MEGINSNITTEDISALDKVVDLIRVFCNKNPLRKYKIDFDKIKTKINQLKALSNSGNESGTKIFNSVLRKLHSTVLKESHPSIFFIVGGHGGIIIDDIGFCEFDVPNFALDRLIEKMVIATKTEMPYNIEVAISCLEWLNNKFPQKMAEFLKLFNRGRFEIINPSYSQPYNLIVGAESNVKQFEYGLKVLKKLGLNSKIFYATESSLHPQLPQILRGFNIKYCSLRARLLGVSPTTSSGNVNWLGLDGTSIDAMTDQSGVFNGEYWHGTFFREIPNLLFQAVGRPFMNYIIYSSIEDFVMPMPYQEEVWRISKLSEIFGKFLRCSEFFQEVKRDGEYKFRRDDFFLGHSILFPHELFLNNKNCEVKLITAEILNCLLGFFDIEYIYSHFDKIPNDDFFDDLWKKLLLTQAHDNYAVPFLGSGDYSKLQLSKEEFEKLEFKTEKISISKLSTRLQKEIQDTCDEYIKKALASMADVLRDQQPINQRLLHVFVFNPTNVPQKNIFSIETGLDNSSELALICENEEISFEYSNSILKFIPEIPGLGYKIYSFVEKKSNLVEKEEDFFYKIEILDDLKTIQVKYKDYIVYELRFQSEEEYTLLIENLSRDHIEENYEILGEIKNQTFKIEIIQYNGVNRLEFILHSHLLSELILIPSIIITDSYINYPFGIEETKRTSIQTLDFLWLRGEEKGIFYMQKNSQKFHINRDDFSLRNSISKRGRFEFAISIIEETEFSSLLSHLNSYLFRLIGIKFSSNFDYTQRSGTFLSISPSVSLINLWRRENGSYLRIFNPSDRLNSIKIESSFIDKPLTVVDLNLNDLDSLNTRETRIGPWKIKTIKY